MGVFSNSKKPKRNGRIVSVGKAGDIPEGRGATIILGDNSEIAVFNVGGKLYGVENFCPHKGFPLADSKIYGNLVECGVHGWRFDVGSGICITEPGCAIETYEVFEENDEIRVRI
jgi:nitrite reductase (NADH) small subunit/3-phenylpropionate/trans-cinnamate dioxygenase ferredoxin subunit